MKDKHGLVIQLTQDNVKQMDNMELLHQLCEHYHQRWSATSREEQLKQDELFKLAYKEINERLNNGNN